MAMKLITPLLSILLAYKRAAPLPAPMQQSREGHALLYQPCADSGSPEGVFGVLQPRQQFKWAAANPADGSQVRMLDNVHTGVRRSGGWGSSSGGISGSTPPLCLTVDATDALVVASCIAPLHSSQNFTYTNTTGLKVGAGTGAGSPRGGQVCGQLSCLSPWMARNMPAAIIRNSSCIASANPCLAYDAALQVFRSLTTVGEVGMCLSVGPPVRPCDHPSPVASHPMCDVTASMEARVADMVARIPPEARASQLVNAAPSIDRLWIPAQNWWNEALHGLLTAHGAVAFPSAVSSATALNRTLFFEIGRSKIPLNNQESARGH